MRCCFGCSGGLRQPWLFGTCRANKVAIVAHNMADRDCQNNLFIQTGCGRGRILRTRAEGAQWDLSGLRLMKILWRPMAFFISRGESAAFVVSNLALENRGVQFGSGQIARNVLPHCNTPTATSASTPSPIPGRWTLGNVRRCVKRISFATPLPSET